MQYESGRATEWMTRGELPTEACLGQVTYLCQKPEICPDEDLWLEVEMSIYKYSMHILVVKVLHYYVHLTAFFSRTNWVRQH